MKRTEYHAADQFELVFGERFAEYFRVFGHEANRAQFDAGVASISAILEYGFPARVARIVCKFNAPGAWCVANSDRHSVDLGKGPENSQENGKECGSSVLLATFSDRRATLCNRLHFIVSS